MPEYRPAPAVERIANKIIPRWHDHLAGERIEYVFRDKAAKKNQKIVLGTCKKISGLTAYLASPDVEHAHDAEVEDFWCVEIAEDAWRELEPHQREALVDHELCHIGFEYDEDADLVTLKPAAHDVEEFGSIIDRHGLWKPDLEEFADRLERRARADSADLDAELRKLSEQGVTIEPLGDTPIAQAVRDAADRTGLTPADPDHDTTTAATENLAELTDLADSMFDDPRYDDQLGGDAA